MSVDAKLAQLAKLRDEWMEAVRVTNGLAQDTVRTMRDRCYALVLEIEAEEPGASLAINMTRRAQGLPPLKSFLELAADPTLGGRLPSG